MKLSKKQKKILILSSLTNMFELYDYTLFPVMLAAISQHFFQVSSKETMVLMGSLTFAISFLFAPIGAFFWGWFGDKYGRAKMIQFSVVFMALPSLLIAITPSYEKIGIAATIIIILARIAQGISASAEVKGAKIFVIEHIGKDHVGLVSGTISTFGALGVFCAMVFGYIISHFPEHKNLWKIGFFIGSFLAITAIFIRKNIAESLEFSSVKQKNIKFFDITKIISSHKHEAIVVFVLGAFLGVLSYTLHAFMNIYLSKLGYTEKYSFLMGMIALIITALASFLTGIYIDIKTDYKNIMKNNLLFSIFIFLPAFLLIKTKILLYTILGLSVLGLMLGINAAISSIIMIKSFSPDIRCRAVLVAYAFGVAAFGGLTPFVLSLVSSYNLLYPAYLLTIFSFFIYIIYNWGVDKYDSMF